MPDGLLWRLPFEALQPSEDHYVADHSQVSYAPSLSALREMRQQRLPAGRLSSLLAYANPELSNNFMTRFELAHSGIELEPSVEHEQVITRIATAYGPATSRLFAGSQASEERIKSGPSRAKIMYFAGPAILDDTSPMSSFIALSSTTAQQDGFLQTREIMDLQSTADLVVAPAAQHSAGFSGNAAVGFSWSWFVAGTRTTLLSRWQVDSSALLTRFYSSIKPADRVSRARALHQSVLALRRSADFQHPYYWAGFAMIGDAR